MKNLIPLLFLPILFSSCANSFEKEVATVDSLLVLMDSAQTMLSELDTVKLNKYKSEGKALMTEISELTKKLNKEDAILLDQYSGTHKAFRKWSEKAPVFYHEVYIIPQQLEDLRRDLSRGLIEKENVAEFMHTETMAATSLYETVEQMHGGLNSVEPIYLEQREKVLLLIERLKAEKQTDS